MPCHADRVRRNYHDIKLIEHHDLVRDETIVTIPISRLAIASAMSAREIQHEVRRIIDRGIAAHFGEAQ